MVSDICVKRNLERVSGGKREVMLSLKQFLLEAGAKKISREGHIRDPLSVSPAQADLHH